MDIGPVHHVVMQIQDRQPMKLSSLLEPVEFHLQRTLVRRLGEHVGPVALVANAHVRHPLAIDGDRRLHIRKFQPHRRRQPRPGRPPLLERRIEIHPSRPTRPTRSTRPARPTRPTGARPHSTCALRFHGVPLVRLDLQVDRVHPGQAEKIRGLVARGTGVYGIGAAGPQPAEARAQAGQKQ